MRRCETAGRAAVARAQCTPNAVVGLLGYVEGAALVAAGAGAARGSVELVRNALQAAAGATAPSWCPRVASFPAYVRPFVRGLVRAGLVDVAAEVAVGMRVRSTAQLGDLAGVAELAHVAGVAGAALRRRDRAVDAHAVRLRAELAVLLAPLGACGCELESP